MAENQQHKPIDTLKGLLRTPSYSGQEQQIQLHIKDTFANSDIEAFFQDENLVVHIPGKDPSRAFIFNSHVDVVDTGDESRWEHAPWSGDIENGRIYGRGASDMKSGVAASIETAKKLAGREELPCDVWFTYVVREEVDGSGTKSFADWFKAQGYTSNYREVAVVFTEPTGMDTIEYGHRGNYFIKAIIDGEAGHASRPREINPHAIVEMTHFIAELEAESALWHDRFASGEFTAPTITPTAIEAKSASPNKVSDHAEATFDLRTVPGFHKEAFNRVQSLAAQRGISISLLYPDAPTGYTDRSSNIVKALQELVPGLKLEVSDGSADLGFMTQIGAEGIIFGPGDKSESHRINESAPVDHLDRAISIYEALYDTWATQPRSRREKRTSKKNNKK